MYSDGFWTVFLAWRELSVGESQDKSLDGFFEVEKLAVSFFEILNLDLATVFIDFCLIKFNFARLE